MSGLAMGTGHVNMTSLLTARALGSLHRRGLAQPTMGNDAMCEGKISPMLPKSQYKISMFFPRPEASDSHVIGETVMNWGFGRTIPVAGEDSVYVVYRWNDCCMQF
jgi:conjugal transfer pilus assembly protein TraU